MAEVVAPDALVDEWPRQHLARVPHEELEQVRLGRRELEAATGAARLHRAEVECEIREAEHVGGLGLHGATQPRTQSRQQLLERERLRQGVVRASIQAVDAAADRIARRQQQDRYTVSFPAQPPGAVEPVVAR